MVDRVRRTCQLGIEWREWTLMSDNGAMIVNQMRWWTQIATRSSKWCRCSRRRNRRWCNTELARVHRSNGGDWWWDMWGRSDNRQNRRKIKGSVIRYRQGSNRGRGWCGGGQITVRKDGFIKGDITRCVNGFGSYVKNTVPFLSIWMAMKNTRFCSLVKFMFGVLIKTKNTGCQRYANENSPF